MTRRSEDITITASGPIEAESLDLFDSVSDAAVMGVVINTVDGTASIGELLNELGTVTPGGAGYTDYTVALTSTLTPSPLNPRKRFDDESLDPLRNSIQQHGIIEPIVVRAQPDGGYEIIAGERRFRAAVTIGLEHVPVRVLENIDDDTALQLMLVENLQRADLNPIEEADAYLALNRAGHTHAQIGTMIGRSPAIVGNAVRLLNLPQDVQEAVADGRLSAGHGVALCRWNQWPHIVTHIARRVMEYQLPVARIAKAVCLAEHPITLTGERNPEWPWVPIRKGDHLAATMFGDDWIANPDCPVRDIGAPDDYGQAKWDVLGWATNAKDACEQIAMVAADRDALAAEEAAAAQSPDVIAVALIELYGDDTKAKAGSPAAANIATARAWLLGEDVAVGGDEDGGE